MSGLRFCFLTTFFPPHNFGGDGIGVRRLALGLVRRGHEVTVIHDVDAYRLLSSGPEPDPVEEPAGLTVVPLRSRLGRVSSVLTHQSGRPLAHGRRIGAIIDEGGFDVVNFHNVSLVGGPGILRYGGDAVRLYMAHEHWLVCPMHVLWRHGRELCTGKECLRCALAHRRPPQAYRYGRRMERDLEEVDTFIAMSEFSRDKHHEFGFPHPMEVLPYFLPDPAPAHDSAGPKPRPHGRPYFLFVGRLEKLKGLQDVLPLFRSFREADLLVVGDGTYEPQLRRAAEGLDHVHFLGRLPQERLGALYDHSLAVVVPSLCYETFGITLIEAFSHRTPVLARRLGPFPEIVGTSGGGELFETAEGLLRLMRRIQGDPEHRDRLASAGYRAFRERWVESAVIPDYLDIVRRAAERRASAAVLERL